MTPAAEDQDLATACMASLVGSLADNKAALGQRYGEWAVSAPTLEAAVAAAAMAQDELGHARSTYPVLKALDTPGEADVDAGRRLALLDEELPDWTSVIAANALVDAVLTTFVAACVDSTVAPMAQRARKILQEEGSHRVHAEAWVRRLCRSPGEREALLARLEEVWEHAGRWLGPDDDPGFRAAMEAGMIAHPPAAQRAQVRDWLRALLAAEGAGGVALAEPADWTGWDPALRRWAA